MDAENRKLSYFTNLCFFLYFIILFVERSISIALSSINDAASFGGGFEAIAFIAVLVSLATWLLYTIIYCREAIAFLFGAKAADPQYQSLAIGSGIILVSGMVHTPYTTTWLQFVAYGIFILGMVLYVVNHKPNRKSVMSLQYLVCFSMAVPVVYKTMMDSHLFFHLFEAITSMLLVILFTYLLYNFLGDKRDNLYYHAPFIIALALDILLIAWRWDEQINYFVIVAISLTLLTFVNGRLYITVKEKGGLQKK